MYCDSFQGQDISAKTDVNSLFQFIEATSFLLSHLTKRMREICGKNAENDSLGCICLLITREI